MKHIIRPSQEILIQHSETGNRYILIATKHELQLLGLREPAQEEPTIGKKPIRVFHSTLMGGSFYATNKYKSKQEEPSNDDKETQYAQND